MSIVDSIKNAIIKKKLKDSGAPQKGDTFYILGLRGDSGKLCKSYYYISSDVHITGKVNKCDNPTHYYSIRSYKNKDCGLISHNSKLRFCKMVLIERIEII